MEWSEKGHKTSQSCWCLVKSHLPDCLSRCAVVVVTPLSPMTNASRESTISSSRPRVRSQGSWKMLVPPGDTPGRFVHLCNLPSPAHRLRLQLCDLRRSLCVAQPKSVPFQRSIQGLRHCRWGLGYSCDRVVVNVRPMLSVVKFSESHPQDNREGNWCFAGSLQAATFRN